jgi:hypothetical protein
MPVSPRMREIEAEIDREIKALPFWTAGREAFLNRMLNYYRDAIEVLLLQIPQIALIPDLLGNLFILEHELHAGVFQNLKWIMEFSGEPSGGQLPDDYEIITLANIGKNYEALVDILKMAQYDRMAIDIDERQRVITIYEGGDQTGSDGQLVIHQAETLPIYAQSPFVEDNDQITSRWCAGDFRRLMHELTHLLEDAETDTIVFDLPEGQVPLSKRPVILDIPVFTDPSLQAVLEDITLTPAKVAGQGKWKLTSWRDIPCTMIGSRRVTPSNLIRVLTGYGGDDYMLRIASRVDPNQYSKVSGLREGRMIALCEDKLRASGWSVTPHYRLTNPSREIDIYATRDSSNLVLQLKSTLRPETPWEASKRNEEILHGIDHTAEVLPQFPAGTIGFVITDGYRGDYVTWNHSLRKGVTVGTIDEVEAVADDPSEAIDTLKSLAGFDPNQQPEPIPTRAFKLFDWTFYVKDEVAP